MSKHDAQTNPAKKSRTTPWYRRRRHPLVSLSQVFLPSWQGSFSDRKGQLSAWQHALMVLPLESERAHNINYALSSSREPLGILAPPCIGAVNIQSFRTNPKVAPCALLLQQGSWKVAGRQKQPEEVFCSWTQTKRTPASHPPDSIRERSQPGLADMTPITLGFTPIATVVNEDSKPTDVTEWDHFVCRQTKILGVFEDTPDSHRFTILKC